jgi:hypothetical protein
MGASRKTIALATERVEQAQEAAKLAKLTLTEYLERMIAEDARRRGVQLPGLIIGVHENKRHVVFGFHMSNSGESVPLTLLEPLEAAVLASYLREAAIKQGQPVTRPITTIEDKYILNVSKQAKAIRLELFTDEDKRYLKTMSRNLAAEVADWLEAAIEELGK